MKIWKSSIVIIGIFILVLSSISVSAENDTADDVLHWDGTDWHNWDWNIADRPNIDILDVSYLIGDRLAISMIVDGSFNSQMSYYHIWFNSTDAWYHASYIPDSEVDPIAVAFPTDFDSWSYEDLLNWEAPETDVSIDGGVLTAVIDWVTDDHNISNFYGWAQEWDMAGEQASEFWIDYAPNDYSPYGLWEDYYGTGNDDEDDDNGAPSPQTPGFETIAVIAALTIAFIISRRRK